MKKFSLLLLIYFFGFVLACCPGKLDKITYNTIESARVMLFSFDEYGMYPYTDRFNSEELGIGVYFGKMSSETEVVYNLSMVNSAYACEPLDDMIYTNRIDSLNVFTVFDYDAEHPAGSKVNDILFDMGEVGLMPEKDINKVSDINHSLKFLAVPQNDSIQFEITGRITDKGEFTDTTELVIL